MNKFRTYELALTLYRDCKQQCLPAFLREQLVRASSSIALNLMEGSAKPTAKDRRRYYYISLGSLREVQALIDLEFDRLGGLKQQADVLGAHLYRLCKSL